MCIITFLKGVSVYGDSRYRELFLLINRWISENLVLYIYNFISEIVNASALFLSRLLMMNLCQKLINKR